MSDAQIVNHLHHAFGITPYELGNMSEVSSGHLYRVGQGIKHLGMNATRKILTGLTEHDRIEAATWFKSAILDR